MAADVPFCSPSFSPTLYSTSSSSIKFHFPNWWNWNARIYVMYPKWKVGWKEWVSGREDNNNLLLGWLCFPLSSLNGREKDAMSVCIVGCDKWMISIRKIGFKSLPQLGEGSRREIITWNNTNSGYLYRNNEMCSI